MAKKKASWLIVERLEISSCVTRELLAAEVGTSVENQRRWFKSEPKEAVIPFDKYAKLFREYEAILR